MLELRDGNQLISFSVSTSYSALFRIEGDLLILLLSLDLERNMEGGEDSGGGAMSTC